MARLVAEVMKMKEDRNQNQVSKEHEEEKTIPSSPWKRLIKKKWFFPAVYLIAAALILAFITWYQNPDDYALDADDLADTETQDAVDTSNLTESDTTDDSDAMPVYTQEEEMIWPVALGDEIKVVLNYFDDEASEDEQLNAMVEYDNTFHPNQGIDFAHKNGETFNVYAALSGTVKAADKDPLVGYYVELEHKDGLVTVYQGLEDLQVSEGDEVKQGDLLGRAGRSVFKQDLGVHAHFEVRENGTPVNPYLYLDGEATEESDSAKEEERAEQAEQEADQEEGQTDEETRESSTASQSEDETAGDENESSPESNE